MAMYVDLYDSRNYYIGEDGEYQKWNIDPKVIEEAADVEEVIRCRDCKHRFESMEMITKDGNTVQFGHYCKATGQIVNDDGFCAWAERRTDDA